MVFRLQDGHGKVASRDPPWIPRGSCKKKNVISDHSFQWTCFQRGSTATVRAGIANQTTQGPFADFQLPFPCPHVRENLPPHEQRVEIHPQGGLADYWVPSP